MSRRDKIFLAGIALTALALVLILFYLKSRGL